MNGLASSAVCEIWEMRKTKLNDRTTVPKRSTLQTCQEQAKALADQNKLPGPGGTGTMTYLDFLGMPPKHQKNKMSKVLRELNGMTNPRDVVHYLPTIGQNVRSYVLKNDGTCDLQEGVVRSYSGNTTAPYVVENKNDSTVNVRCSLTDIAERLEQTDGLTHEEQRVKDSFIVKHFKTEQLSELDKVKQTRQALREGKKTKNKADGIEEYHGGIRKVYRDQNSTWLTITYQDQDEEDVKLQDALTEIAFKEDHNKRIRLLQMRAAILARIRGDAAPAGSSKWAKTKRYRTRTQSRLQLSKDHTSAQQRLRACGNREGRVVKDPHIIWSWSKPGIFFLAGAPAKSRQGGRGLCGGPGIPNGAVGDYG